ncbi:TIR domain-containing protein [Kribbella sp. CA-247076]|uniref:TIR domain-containing protein n=1 Tax=Kribbella sp. CA-247076 TaxID=3239941 RepID=UPI003D89EE90
MTHASQRQLQFIAERAANRTIDSTRHKCFISYHAEDTDEVANFLDTFGTEFIAKTIGVTDEDDFIDSQDTGYIMDKIRTKYLGDSSVTIVLVGKCTWARRYVDWEIYSSLRNSAHSKMNGLLAIQLPGALSTDLPPRLQDNVIRDANKDDIGYARWNIYPSSKSSLRSWISDAFNARTTRAHLKVNTRDRKIRNSSCL